MIRRPPEGLKRQTASYSSRTRAACPSLQLVTKLRRLSCRPARVSKVLRSYSLANDIADVVSTCTLGAHASTESASNDSTKAKPVATVEIIKASTKHTAKVVPVAAEDVVQSFETQEAAQSTALAVEEGSGKLAARLEIDVAAAVASCPPPGPQR
jgi:hypothetical protein